jgi:hypothetical protein
MRKLQIVALSCLLTPAALPAQAQTASVACLYMLLTATHAAVTACGPPLDGEHEANYVTLHSAVEKFIRENARSDPDGLLAALQRSSRPPPPEKTCDPSFRRSLETMTAPETVAKIQEGMKTPSDPMVGGCL